MSDEAITLDGVTELTTSLRRASRELDNLDTAAKRSATEVAELAKTNAPRLTGALRRSILGVVVEHDARITAGVPYAAVQEYGSRRRNIPARRYMRNALASAQRGIATAYVREVNGVIHKIKGA